MKLALNSEQKLLLNKLNINFNMDANLSDDEIEKLDDKVSDYFSLCCIQAKDEVSKEGQICESIIELIR